MGLVDGDDDEDACFAALKFELDSGFGFSLDASAFLGGRPADFDSASDSESCSDPGPESGFVNSDDEEDTARARFDFDFDFDFMLFDSLRFLSGGSFSSASNAANASCSP